MQIAEITKGLRSRLAGVSAAGVKESIKSIPSEVAKMFTPNAKQSARSLGLMLAAQVLIAYWCWNTFKPELMPGPKAVFTALFKIATDGAPIGAASPAVEKFLNLFTPVLNSSLITQLWPSLMLTIQAMVRAIGFALVLCYLSVVPWFRPSAIVATKGRYAAVAGLQFVFMLWTNDGHSLKVLLLEFAVSVFFITGMVSVIAAKCVPGSPEGSLRYDHARSLGWNPWRVWFEITVLGTLAEMLDLVRQNFAICWTMLTMVETIIMSEGGVGKMMFLENKYMRMDNVLALQFAIIITGIMLDLAISAGRMKACPYIKK